jgi:hypothetical protein
VVLFPDVVPLIDRRFDCCDLLQRNVVHHGAGKPSGINMDKLHFDPTDYSVVVKNRAPPPNSWKWVIYRAGRSSPVKQSSAYFHTMVTANRAGKEALKQLLEAPISRAD